MEEWVGEQWHRLITRVADNRHPDAGVRLAEVQHSIGVFYRALGGDGGLQIELSDPTVNRHRRSRLQRFAGVQSKIHLAWRDERALRLPPRIAWFDQASLNRELYFWLAAIAAVDAEPTGSATAWIERNRCRTRRVLQQFPGLRARYRRLVEHHLAQRPDPTGLQGREADAETLVRDALRHPERGTATALSLSRVQPVPLWLHPEPPLQLQTHRSDASDDAQQRSEDLREPEDIGRRQAEQVEEPEQDRGLVTVRMENIFTLGEFVNVDRGSEEEEDSDRAEAVARDLDTLSVSKDARDAKASLKFDLDLPSAVEDDAVLEDGLLLPEWDWKAKMLKPDRCRVVLMQADDAAPRELPAHLLRTARKLRNQFQALAPSRTWHNRQSDGHDIDIDACIRYAADREAGKPVFAGNLYRELRSGDRDLCCLLLADLSLSTDTWVDNHERVIDVIRDSLYLFGESLHTTGDRFALYGFSSRKRDPIRVHAIKTFGENYGAAIRGRIDAIKPGYYTRLGAGIRFASRQLMKEGNGKRLLLVLTDGKPNDLDHYEGRYGIEDTRQAVIAARRAGLLPFCVTIDRKGNEYLPHIFGRSDYIVIRDPKRLPKELPRLYSLLTA